jgi:hypothetical protein
MLTYRARETGSNRITENVPSHRRARLVLSQDPIEEAGLPQPNPVHLLEPKSRFLLPVSDERYERRIGLVRLEQQVDMIGHETVRKYRESKDAQSSH